MKLTPSQGCWLTLALLLTGCPSTPGPSDAQTDVDAGDTVDSGDDAGVPSTDAGPPDDAGSPFDASITDAGSPFDASIADAGVFDAGPPLPRYVLTLQQATALFSAGQVSLDAGIYVLPVDFTIDLGATDLSISGVPGRTIITSYDGTPATDFNPAPLDTTRPDTHADGLYVVTRHPDYSYGGGFAHLDLPWVPDGGAPVRYTQGTILTKTNGLWSRHFTGAGFKTAGNVHIEGVTFENCQFYLFSPFGLAETTRFGIVNSRFKNLPRVLSSCLYGGIDHEPNWFNALNNYPVDGTYRFGTFEIRDSRFEDIHTALVWGFPPSRVTTIMGNTITHSHAIAFFNLFMKNYADVYSFNQQAVQTITGNTFTNIIEANGWTAQLLRTSGRAEIRNNAFINVTAQAIMLYGGDSTIADNHVLKIDAPNETQSVVVLVKSTVAPGTAGPLNTFTHNTVSAPQAIFIGVEGASSHDVSDNTLEVRTAFSKNDSTQGVGQYLHFTRNHLAGPNLTNIASHDTSTSFSRVTIDTNVLARFGTLHTGNTPIGRYAWVNNTVINPLFPQLVQTVPTALAFDAGGNVTSSCPGPFTCPNADAGCMGVPRFDATGCVVACGQFCP